MRPERPVEGYDLHVHTTHSDGSLAPGDVVRAARAVGLRGLAITDHDSLSAIAVARPEADRLGVELIPGVELTVSHENREFHLLAYFVDDADPALVEALRAARDGAGARIARLIEGLERHFGLRIDPDALRRAHPRARLGRRHLADWLVRTGQAPSRAEVFARYLGDESPLDASKPGLPRDRAIALARDAGGATALAHPPPDLGARQLDDWKSAGLDAVETESPGASKPRRARLRDLAARLGLIPVGGTDFHAPDGPGRWIGAIRAPGDAVERLRALAADRPRPARLP